MSHRSGADQRYMEALIEQASKDWPRMSQSRHSRGKVACPECGAGGWPGGSWTHRHLDHVVCDCGKVVSQRGLKIHQSHHGGRQ